MFQKLIATTAIISILFAYSAYSQTKQNNDWAAVEDLAGKEAAIKSENGKTQYGIIRSVGKDSLVLQIAGKNGMTTNEITHDRTDITKVWTATLFKGSGNAGKGALIGAGAGAGIGAISIAASKESDPLNGAAVVLLAVVGAGIGAVFGKFLKKKHKKHGLIYKR